MTSKGYLTFILDHLSEVEGITFRSMMGEFLLYRDGRLFGGLYDNRFLVKSSASLRKFLQERGSSLIEEEPYPGAKKMIRVRDCEDKAFLENLVRHC